MTITPEQQRAAVVREIGLRKSVYKGRVARGQMKPEQAEYEIAAMEAVLKTLDTRIYGYFPFRCTHGHAEIGFGGDDGKCPVCEMRSTAITMGRLLAEESDGAH